MMHHGRRQDRGAASGSRFGRSLHICFLVVLTYVIDILRGSVSQPEWVNRLLGNQ